MRKRRRRWNKDMARFIFALFILSLPALGLFACQTTDERANSNLSAPTPTPDPSRVAQTAGSPGGHSDAVSTEGAPAATVAQAPPSDVVRAEVARVEVRAGGSAEAEVWLRIAPGYHINANPPTHKYLIATQLDVAHDGGITAGKPVYPQPLSKRFAFDPSPLAVYETEAKIRLPLSVSSIAAKGEQSLAARLRVQPCDEQACYPPRTIETSIPLRIN